MISELTFGVLGSSALSSIMFMYISVILVYAANIQEEDSKEQLWIQLNHLFNNRGSRLSHTTDTAYEGIVPQRMHLSHTVYIHIIKRKSVQYEQLIYSGPTTLAPEYQSLLHINHIKSCSSYWHHTFIYLASPFSYHLYSETSHRPFHISSILISTIYKHVCSVQ